MKNVPGLLFAAAVIALALCALCALCGEILGDDDGE